MTLNIYSVVMSIVLFTVISTICSLFLSRTKSKHLWIVTLILVLSLLRCLVPVEITGVFTVNCWEIYPELFDVVRYTLFRGITVGHLLLAVWLSGSCLFLLKQIIEISRQVQLIRRENASPADADILEIAKKAASAVGCETPVEVYIVLDSFSPAMVGFFKPKIILPEYTFIWKEKEIDYILRHEISHYKGGDIWIRLTIQLLVCFLWWNPAVYLFRSSVIQLLELRSDDRACRSLNDEERSDYSEVLVKVLRKAADLRKSALSISFVGHYHRSFLRQRIKILTSDAHSRQTVWKSLLTASICIVLFAASYSVILQPAYAPPKEEGDYSISPETAWLVPLSDGKYELWIDGNHVATISSESVKMPPFNQLPIHKETTP